MYRFWRTIIKPVLKMVGAKSIVEIGAQNGYTTEKLIDYIDYDGIVYSIDPFPMFDYELWEKKFDGIFKMQVGLSLDVLPYIPASDVYLIDGDHNWYTVYNELKYISKICVCKAPVIILHDVSWPYERRDLYYNPENIPAEYINKYEKKGIEYGRSKLDANGINGNLYNAIECNTPQNGVLTAIEDFLREETRYEFIKTEVCNGLGIIKQKEKNNEIFDYVNSKETLRLLLKQTEQERIQTFQQRCKYKRQFDETGKMLVLVQERLNENEKNLLSVREKLEEKERKLNLNEELNEQIQQENNFLKSRLETEKEDFADKIKELEIDKGDLKNQIKQLETNKEDSANKIKELETEKKDLKKEKNSLEKINQQLRDEGKLLRKQCRDLKKGIEKIHNSISFRICKHLIKIIWLLISPIMKLMGKRKDVSNSDIMHENNECSHKIFPVLSDYSNKSVYGDNVTLKSVSVVVCIHNAFNDVVECLNSLWNKRTFPYKIILIDDGSDEETQRYVEEFAHLFDCSLYRNSSAIGYTKSANIGLRMSNSDYTILLNSDTIVTDSWVEKMLECFERNPKTGIVSPLSNAATYQSVPESKDLMTGDWKINTLDKDMTVDMMGMIVEKTSKNRYPIVNVLNGFCFMISRDVINEIGYLDEESFPMGYGEEVDYCLRAVKKGFTLRVADNVYIFHEKSKSFTHQTRKQLGTASKPVLRKKHGEVYSELGKAMDKCKELNDIRIEIKEAILTYKKGYSALIGKKIAFVLTAKGGSGGANSICQEVLGMRNLGMDVSIINSANYKEQFDANYPEIRDYVEYFNQKSNDDFLSKAQKFDILICTIFTTVQKVEKVKRLYPNIKIAYYVQDYEPFFFSDSDDYYKEAKESYTRIEEMCLFAKTKWITDTVNKYHNVEVKLVESSIDTKLYNPFVIKEKRLQDIITICAMIRPQTIRRNPKGTMDVLEKIKNNYKDKVRIELFGCTNKEINSIGQNSFEYTNRGILKRWEVARLLAESDIFLDMSTYQAFGRTGLEGMCLGCIPVLPRQGGVDRFAVDNINSLIVDTSNVDGVYGRICELIDNLDKIHEMQIQCLETAKKYNVINAAWSEIQVLNNM